jgi:catechol 2,3-dioxygenase-like lactoylglutathione lyase family enzyme
MEKSLDFYVGALGFTKAFELPNPKTGEPWIVYLHACGGQFVELFYNGEIENPWNGRQIGFSHLCFAVDDIRAMAERIKGAGQALDSEPTQGSDSNWQCWVTDPNGIRIELMQISPESPQAKFS